MVLQIFRPFLFALVAATVVSSRQHSSTQPLLLLRSCFTHTLPPLSLSILLIHPHLIRRAVREQARNPPVATIESNRGCAVQSQEQLASEQGSTHLVHPTVGGEGSGRWLQASAGPRLGSGKDEPRRRRWAGDLLRLQVGELSLSRLLVVVSYELFAACINSHHFSERVKHTGL